MTKPKREPADTAEKLYRETRAGATAARGYHFQDAIGAWFAARLLVGDVEGATRVVPEDWEDITVEGPAGMHVQIKSRQAGRKFFSVNEVAKIVIEMWEKHGQREAVDVDSSRLLLLLERGLHEETPLNKEIALADIPKWQNVQSEIRRLAPDLSSKLETLESITRVHIIDGATACRESSDLIASNAGAYHAAARIVVQSIRTAIIDSTDQNATREIALGRIGLGASDVNRIVKETLGLVDQMALEEAIRLGDCEALDFSIAEAPSGFYQGIAVQPGHVAANLATPRHDLVEQALARLKAGTHLLLEGPSGVGKSTAMWLTAQASPEILWYRIRPSATGAAIARLLKLARASAPSTQHQVGFILDGVGLAETGIWDGMVREASAIPGLVLLGSIRTEDAFLIQTRSACEIITVSLDEATAADIHRKLLADGATEAPHWREAFEKAEALTMEYTHLLTQGKRIQDVVEEQVVRRVQEDREVELDIIALVSTADQWGAHLDFQSLVSATSATPGDLRKALARLGGEHIVREDGEQVRGVHQLRSRFLSKAAHDYPPPLKADTIGRLVRLLSAADLERLIIGSLWEAAVDDAVLLDGLSELLNSQPEGTRVELFDAVTNALREVEYRRRIASWNEVFERHRIPVPLRATSLQLAMTGDSSMPELKDEIQAALPDLRKLVGSDLQLGTELVRRLPADYVLGLFTSGTSIDVVMRTLGALVGIVFTFPRESGALLDETPIGDAIDTATAEELSQLIVAVKVIDERLAATVISRAGGDEGILERLKSSESWIKEATIVEEDGEQIPKVRAVQITEMFQDSPDDANRELAKTVAGLFPYSSHVDVKTQLAGDIPLKLRDYEQGVSLLQQRYTHSPISVAWRRKILTIAATAYSARSQTERACVAAELLTQTDKYLQLLGTTWVLGRDRGLDEMRRLSDSALGMLSSVAPYVPSDPDERVDVPSKSDPLYTLIDGVFVNLTSRLAQSAHNLVPLSFFVSESLRKALHEVVAGEPWRLIDFDPTEVSASIDARLLDLSCVIEEKGREGNLSKIVSVAARSGDSRRSLQRAAAECGRLQKRRRESVLREIVAQIEAKGIDADVHVRDLDPLRYDKWPPCELLVAVRVKSVQDWYPTLEKFVELIARGTRPIHLMPTIWAVPIVNGKPIQRFCVRVSTNTWPAMDALESWEDVVGKPHATPLTDSLVEALDALDSLSGLAYLSCYRETGSLQKVAEDLGARFEAAWAKVDALCGSDSQVAHFLLWLKEQLDRVQAELDRKGLRAEGDPEHLAVETAKAITGYTPMPESFSQRLGIIIFAAQYDIDPTDAGLQALLA